jgi:hypothetical protein
MVGPKTASAPITQNNAIPAPSSSVEDTSAGSINTGATSATISYASAAIKYQNALIELDKVCKASPSRLALKNNTNIMIDNRSAMDRVVKVGSPMNLRAYSFKIVNVSSATLPATWPVGCDQNQNVATITIQK